MSTRTHQRSTHRRRDAGRPGDPGLLHPPRTAHSTSPSPPNSHGTIEVTASHRTAAKAQPHSRTRKQPPRRYQRLERQRRRNLLLKVGGVIVVGVAVLAIIFFANTRGSASGKSGQAGQYPFDVASPAAGAVAPDFTLPSTSGGTIHLSDFRGKTVLLYFQEGIGCEGCWTQMKDMQTNMGDFKRLGIDTMLTVTTNPLGALKQKVADEGITLPVLSDESFGASRAYNATAYGMMAGSADGHTFILVGPDGRIRWRADYGGPPNYTMYVPVGSLLADLKAGIQADSKGATNGK